VQARVAVAGGLSCLVGFGALLVLAWRRAGSPGLDGYLSQLGGPGQPGAATYRLAVLCIAGAAALVGLAWRLQRPGLGVAGMLWGCSGLFVISAAVPCAAGCPIPLHDGLGTPANFVHFAVSGGAFAAAVAAMVLAGRAPGDRVLRRLSTAAARTASVVFGALAVLMLVFGHGIAGGVAERVLATVCLGWLVAGAVRLCRRPRVPVD